MALVGRDFALTDAAVEGATDPHAAPEPVPQLLQPPSRLVSPGRPALSRVHLLPSLRPGGGRGAEPLRLAVAEKPSQHTEPGAIRFSSQSPASMASRSYQ